MPKIWGRIEQSTQLESNVKRSDFRAHSGFLKILSKNYHNLFTISLIFVFIILPIMIITKNSFAADEFPLMPSTVGEGGGLEL